MKNWLKAATWAEVIAALFILLFSYTALNKYIAIRDLQHVLKEYPLIGAYWASVAAWGMPALELAIATLLFIPSTRLCGLYASFILMVSFTLYVAYMLVAGSKLPCTCGGMLQALSWPQHLYFNIFFVLLALAGIKLYKTGIKTTGNKKIATA